MNKFLAIVTFLTLAFFVPKAHAHAAFGFGSSKAYVACLSRAVSNHSSSVKSAKADLKTALSNAGSVFSTALKSSKNTKQARADLRDSVTLAQKTFANAEKIATANFKKDLTACK